MTDQEIVVLTRSEIASLMDYPAYVDAVEAALKSAADGAALAPPAAGFQLAHGSYHAKAAALLDGTPPMIAIKLNGNFPGNPARNGLPTVQGIIYLADASNGRPLAMMDSIEVTINRTGAATTIAARYLARPDSRTATICGAGVQGRIQAIAVAAAYRLKTVHVWDIVPGAAVSLAANLSRTTDLDARPASDLSVAVESDIVVTCTSARQPFLTRELISPGTFIAAVGADNPDKCEIAPSLYACARVVVDSAEQCAEIGDLHHALAAGTVAGSHVRASLTDLVAGRASGRTSDSEITLFDSTGLGLQDVAAAAAIYRRALQAGAGRRLRFS